MPSRRAVRVALRRRVAGALALCFLLVVTGKGSPSAEAAQFTRLLLHVMATTTLSLTIIQDSAKCTLVNTGSAYAALDFGTASSSAHTSCGTYSLTGSTYKLSTTFSVLATCSGACGSTYKLSAQLLTAAPTGVTHTYGGKTLATTATTISTTGTYGTAQSKTYALKVKTSTAASGSIQQQILFTVADSSTPSDTATATLNVEEINEPGISIYFTQDASGVAMTGGAFAAALDFGSVSAYGTLPANVTRSNVTGTSFTVSTPIDVDVEVGGDPTSTSYTLQGALASLQTGITYEVDGVSLTTSNQNITTSGSYGTATSHTLSLMILTAASGSGGPSIGTPISDTINFTATAN